MWNVLLLSASPAVASVIAGAAVVAAMGVRHLLSWPKPCTKPPAATIDTSKQTPGVVYLYQFPTISTSGVPNISPFCVKVETWLRIQGIPYEVVVPKTPNDGPKGKLPFIAYNGEVISDSSVIIRTLVEKGVGRDLDSALNPKQKAVTHAMTRTCEESLYWIIVYLYWVVQPQETSKVVVANPKVGLPWILRKLIPPYISRSFHSMLSGLGLGRNTVQEINELGIQDLKAIEAFLGDGSTFAHDTAEPTMLDVVLFSSVVLLTDMKATMSNAVCQYARNSAAFRRYTETVKKAVWKDWDTVPFRHNI